ncbi:hypothetical protein ACJMK2_006895, partial [Sinanodonta woodiana]
KETDISFKHSLVQLHNGKTCVEVDKYLDHIGVWDKKFGLLATHDHAMLFT